jgi:hypothetical protein
VQLVLYDGRTDTEAWVAAAPPVPADTAKIAASFEQGLRNEQHAPAYTSLGAVALIALLGAVLGWWVNRRARAENLAT